MKMALSCKLAIDQAKRWNWGTNHGKNHGCHVSKNQGGTPKKKPQISWFRIIFFHST